MFDSPAAGFDEPFAMLPACHECVERSLSLLEPLAAHGAQNGADAKAQDAPRDVLRCFDIAAAPSRTLRPKKTGRGREQVRAGRCTLLQK